MKKPPHKQTGTPTPERANGSTVQFVVPDPNNSIIKVARRPHKAAGFGAAQKRVNPIWAWHYRTLVQLRERLVKDRADQISDVRQPAEPHSMHLADSATDEFDHELATRELEVEANLLYEVDQAIKRILDGTYGKCELTGKRILAARLRAIPWTRYSTEAKAKLDLGGFIPPLPTET